MRRALRVLLVEDSVDDAELLLAELRRAGFDPSWTRVETEKDFLSEIARLPDVILSDYSMPQFNGIRAAQLLKREKLDIPFILVSGTVGEDVAVEAMRHGATDYLLKDRTGRLGSAVERALREAQSNRDQKRAESALQAAQLQLQKTLEYSPVVIYSLKVEGGDIVPQTVSENILGLVGYSAEECLAPDWWKEHVHPDDAARLSANTDGAGVDVISHGYRFRHRDGHYVWLEDRRRIVRNAAGAPVEISGVWIDITARRDSEIALELLHRNHALILDSVDEGIQGIDCDGNITFENVASARMFGRSTADAVGKNAHELVHHSSSDGAPFRPEVCPINATLNDGVSRRIDNEVFWRIDGTAFPVEYVVAPKLDDHGSIDGVVVVFHNIAERRSLEAQFRQSQKLESVGQLAGGIAHDFNNILSIMMMQAELALLADGIPADVRDGLAEICSAAERAANLTRQLLLFSRKQVMQPTSLDVNRVVTDLTKMLARIVPEDVSIEVQLSTEPLVTFADSGMLDQVLMNLTVNARDAMPNGGRLIITTFERTVRVDEVPANPDASPGEFVGFSVSDTGVGIAPDVLGKIFEPFFTTKEAGKGTGLGLATVFGVIKQHHGWIDVQSELGVGTTITIFLPASHGRLDGSIVGDVTNAASTSGTETVLVAEDDAAVRVLTCTVLQRKGYAVLEAVSGVDALRVWADHSEMISLLLTDLVMPGGIDGWQLAAALQTEKATLKVVFTSGYSAEIAGRELKLGAGQAFIRKPCSTQTLLETVRSVLDHA